MRLILMVEPRPQSTLRCVNKQTFCLLTDIHGGGKKNGEINRKYQFVQLELTSCCVKLF